MSTRERYTFDAKAAADYLGLKVKQLYTIAEAGEIDHLRTCKKIARRVIHGQSRTVRVSGRLKFSQDGLDAWLAAHREPLRRGQETSAPGDRRDRRLEELPPIHVRHFAR